MKGMSRDRGKPKDSRRFKSQLPCKDRDSLRGKDEARDGMGGGIVDAEGISKADGRVVEISPRISNIISRDLGSKMSSKWGRRSLCRL